MVEVVGYTKDMGINNFIKDYGCLFTTWDETGPNPTYIYIDILAVIYKLMHILPTNVKRNNAHYMRICDNILKQRLKSVLYNLWFMNSKYVKAIIILKDDKTQERYINKWCRRRVCKMTHNRYNIPNAERVAQLIIEYYSKTNVRIYTNMRLNVEGTSTTGEYVYLDANKDIGWKETDQNIYNCILDSKIGNGPTNSSIICIINDSDYIMMDTIVRYTFMDRNLPTINYYMINYRKPVNERFILRDTLERVLPATVITIMYMLLYSTRYGNDYIHRSVSCKNKHGNAKMGMKYHNAFINSLRNGFIIKRINSQIGFQHLYYLYERVIKRCQCNYPLEIEMDYNAIIQYVKLCTLNQAYVWYSYNVEPPNNICAVNRVRNVLHAFKNIILLGL